MGLGLFRDLGLGIRVQGLGLALALGCWASNFLAYSHVPWMGYEDLEVMIEGRWGFLRLSPKPKPLGFILSREFQTTIGVHVPGVRARYVRAMHQAYV